MNIPGPTPPLPEPDSIGAFQDDNALEEES